MDSNKFIQKNRRQGGYTIVELAIAVSIIGVLIVAGLTGVQSILTGNKVSKQLQTTAKLSILVLMSPRCAAPAMRVALTAKCLAWRPSRIHTQVSKG
jgi:prepilin-type N-terminal cleavage/methylation domain-containing protein